MEIDIGGACDGGSHQYKIMKVIRTMKDQNNVTPCLVSRIKNENIYISLILVFG